MKQRIYEDTEKIPETEHCHHYWAIDVANGPKSVGKCKYCGETREFLNAYPHNNPMKRRNNPLDLPKLPEVEIDKQSES